MEQTSPSLQHDSKPGVDQQTDTKESVSDCYFKLSHWVGSGLWYTSNMKIVNNTKTKDVIC